VPARSILLAAHLAPPSTMSAARRIGGLASHLAARGHRVSVLTSRISGSGPVPGTARTVRTRDLMASRLNWRAGSFEALAGETQGDYDARPSALAAVVVPDLLLAGWVPFALPHALGLARSERFDCVITSSPPASGHLIGRALRARGIPWIADFRDGWTFERSAADFPTAPQRWLDRRLERWTVDGADRVTGVTPPITEDLTRRLGAAATTITNGFDPALAPAPAPDHARPDPGRHTIVYTGSLAYGGRAPVPLLAALRRLRDTAPDVADRIELLVAGPMSSAERAAFEEPGLDGMVRAVGSLPHAQALALQRDADSLLVVAGERASVATGKLYEYLAARRPILVLGARSAAAAMVADAHAGIAVSADDPDAIARALERLALPRPGEELAGASADAIARFSYRSLAAEMEQEVERAIAAAGRQA
jgi:glycosyltransferase involved in cell wall biosynthesis